MGESSYNIGRGAPPITWAQALGCREPLQLRQYTSVCISFINSKENLGVKNRLGIDTRN
jgi:hypothetical protein